MGVDPRSIELRIVDDELMPDAAGTYHMREQSVICVAVTQLDDPMRLMATVAHELAHELLLKGGHLTGNEHDHEQVTDLLPVFLGTGIFAANATVQTKSWSEGQWSHSTYSRQGYLSSIELGYALAVFANFRGEDRPNWSKHLRTDAAVTLRDSLRYLRKSGDTLFHPEGYVSKRARSTTSNQDLKLADPSPTVRLNALLDLSEQSETPPASLLPATLELLADSDPHVQRMAVRVLGKFGPAAADRVPDLIELSRHGRTEEIRVEATVALGGNGANPDQVIPILIANLGVTETKVVCAAADALGRFGPLAEPAQPKLIEVLEAAASLSDRDRVTHVVIALRTIHPEGAARVRTYFASADPEVRRTVIEELIRQEGDQ
jgi:hypothetical protein